MTDTFHGHLVTVNDRLAELLDHVPDALPTMSDDEITELDRLAAAIQSAVINERTHRAFAVISDRARHRAPEGGDPHAETRGA